MQTQSMNTILTCGYVYRRASGRRRADVANSALTIAVILRKENSLLLVVKIQSHHAVIQVHRRVGGAVIGRVQPQTIQCVVCRENKKLV